MHHKFDTCILDESNIAFNQFKKLLSHIYDLGSWPFASTPCNFARWFIKEEATFGCWHWWWNKDSKQTYRACWNRKYQCQYGYGTGSGSGIRFCYQLFWFAKASKLWCSRILPPKWWTWLSQIGEGCPQYQDKALQYHLEPWSLSSTVFSNLNVFRK